MTLSRRDFTSVFVAAAAGAAMPRSLLALAGPSQETFFDWRSVGDRIHVAFGQGGNVMLFRDGGEALISDSKNLGYGFALRREAERMGTALRWAVNTHHHGDHIGGNAVFAADVPLLAHPTARTRIRGWAEGVVGAGGEGLANALQQMRERGESAAVIGDVERALEQIRTADAERFVPTREVAESEELRVGGRTVLLQHVGAGHTDNDVFLFLPEENVLHTGDLLFNGTHGFMDQNGGVTSAGWQRSVQVMMSLVDGDTVVIPGHGEITNGAALRRQWEYFEQLRDAVTAAVRDGMSKEQVMQLRPDALADVQGNPSRNLGVAYDEITHA
jgi:glyoxylase-like metal-dependent hydrolase (beta-lactamase superfamily II)